MKGNKLIFSQKAFIFNRREKFLILRRTKTAPRYALFWDLPGGIVEQGELPARAIRREIKEEAGISVDSLAPFGAQFYPASKAPWAITAYAGRAVSTKIRISWEHDKFEWVTVKRFLKLKTAAHLKKFARELSML